jgi:hypothetical protein
LGVISGTFTATNSNMKLNRLITPFLFGFLFFSCEKAIEFKLDESSPSLVIEATIENNEPPIVIVTNSTGFFNKITPQILESSFIRNAEITISNGTKNHRLKEYFFSSLTDNKIYYYSIDSANLSTAFIGELNTRYTMQLKVNGKTYNASTTIPPLTKKIDSLFWKKAPDNPDTTKVVLSAKITDPPGLGNYIRYFTSVNEGFFFPGFNSVFDDKIIDGKKYEVEIPRGVDRNEKIDAKNFSFFNKGDTVVVKFCNIDKPVYDFWSTMEYSYGSIGNPFSSPVKVAGNIEGALGYFGGYAVQYKSLIIPK